MSLPPMAYCDSKAKETIKNHIKGDRFSILLNGIFHKSAQKREDQKFENSKKEQIHKKKNV